VFGGELKEDVEGDDEKGVALMLVADAIGRLAMRLARQSRAIFSAIFERVRDVQRRRQWVQADGGGLSSYLVRPCFAPVAVRWLSTARFSRSGVGPEAGGSGFLLSQGRGEGVGREEGYRRKITRPMPCTRRAAAPLWTYTALKANREPVEKVKERGHIT
jgi:hypothetical protein